MDSNDIGYVLLGSYIVTGEGRETRFARQYPCIGPTGAKNTVAVYTYSQECADAIEERMAAWKALSHPGVPAPVKYGWENGRFMVAMEQDLSEMLPLGDKRFDAEFYPMGDDTPYEMLTHAGDERLLKSAEVLEYIASQGFVCGCVTPENMLCGDERVYLNELLVLRGGCVPAYCSMEQIADIWALTYKTDVYSWAVSVMELYLGERPWRSGIAAGRESDEYLERAEHTRGMPNDMSRLLKRCLAIDPDARPDWAEIVDTLRGWVEEWELQWGSGGAPAPEPNRTVLDYGDNESAHDPGKTVYLPPESETDRDTTPDGKYRIGRRIELDPPFDIYEAEEVNSGKAVTLLRLTPESRDSEAAKDALFKRYINSLNAAYDERIEPNHTCEYIVRWSDPTFGDKDDIEYLIADTPYGKSLAIWGRENVPLGKNTALYLICRLFKALEATHSRGMEYMGQGEFATGMGVPLVHRSVGAANIRIIEREDGGLPLLMLDGFDTAIPTRREAENFGQSWSELGDVSYCGVPAFSSRQQLVNADSPDYAWDVWASAACLYYLLTGEYPRDLSGNTWAALLNNKPIPIRERRPEIAPALAEVIDRALDDSGDLYYPDLLSFWRDIIDVSDADDEEEAEKEQSSAPEEGGKTVFEGDAAEPEGSRTVYEGDKTILDSAQTVLDGGTTLNDGAPVSETAPINDDFNIHKGEMLLDTYRVETDSIESGGMGQVWRVRHTGWNADLAMKRPRAERFADEKGKELFSHECEAWINLGLHPNIVSCYYVRRIGGVPAIFSEWMDGGSLEDAIENGALYAGSKAAQQERLLDTAIQFARGLKYAHDAGLIHQDVKPDNVLLTKEGEVKVADFGMARARAVLTVLEGDITMAESSDGRKSVAAHSGGYTPAYCSTEQMDGKELTRRTDIYSWAVSVMEMYLGKCPWANGVVAGTVCQVYFTQARIPMPEALKELLAQCLASEPDDRPHDFAEVEAKLHEIYRAEAGSDYPRPAPKAAADTADSLNNRALSFLDLGREDMAAECLDRALTVDPDHSKALYNRAIYQWHKGEITGEDAERYVRMDFENHFGNSETSVYLAKINLEMGDAYRVNGFLGQAGDCEEADALRAEMDKADYRCDYALCRIKDYREQERLQKLYDEKEREIRGHLAKADHEEATREFIAASMSPEYQGFVLSPAGLAIETELSRCCYPAFVRSTHLARSIGGTGGEPCSFSADSSKLLCGGKLYDAESGALIADNSGEKQKTVAADAIEELKELFPGYMIGAVSAVSTVRDVFSSINPDGSCYLYCGGSEKEFVRVDAKTGELTATFSGHTDSINGLSISLDGTLAISASDDGTARLWSMDGSPVTTVFSRNGAVRKAVLSYDNRRVLLMTEKNLILIELESQKYTRIYEHEASNELPSFFVNLDDGLFDFAVNTSFDTVAIALGRGGLASYDIPSGKLTKHRDEKQAARGLSVQRADRVCFMPNDQLVLCAANEYLYFWFMEQDTILSMIPCAGDIRHLAISRNGKYAAASSGQRTELWRCCYVYKPVIGGKWNERDVPYAKLALARNPDKLPEAVVGELMEELRDRGFGCVSETDALAALRALKGTSATKADKAPKPKGPVKPVTMFKNSFKVHEGLLFGYSGTERELVVPEGVIKIGRRTFEGNAYIRSVTLPHGLEEIQEAAFKNCAALEKAVIPDTIKMIGSAAFANCPRLRMPVLPDGLEFCDDAFDEETYSKK